MLKKNKLKVILSAIFILLPMLFGIIMWNDLPNTMTTHWGADGNADGFSGKAFAVFGVPCIILILHFICLWLTLLDKKQKEQNPKALSIIFGIFPIISIWANGIMYRAAFGFESNLILIDPIIVGLMLVFMGNYLPKIKQNRTLGIKTGWAMHNEENWNKTHRFGGKVWFIGGLILLCAVLLPAKAIVGAVLFVIIMIAVLPFIYSYLIYRQHRKNGIAYVIPPRSKAEKIAVRISAVVVPVILIGVAVLMFTGNIEVKCEDTSLSVNATYWTDIEVAYSDIDTVEYREDFDVGIRTNGFGSAKLSMGIFENEEFGSYTLYAYTGAKEFIVISSEGKNLVIGMRDTNDTKAIYGTILQKID